MRIKGLKNLSIGKTKDKEEEDKTGANDTTATQITEMGENIDGRTEDLEVAAQELQELSDKEESEGTPQGPHGPIGELSVEPEGDEADLGLSVEANVSDQLEENKEEVQLVDLGTETNATPETETENEIKPDGGEDSFDNLFSDEEKEENPLENLINSLPDVTAQELLDDLNEIHGIIKEWQRH